MRRNVIPGLLYSNLHFSNSSAHAIRNPALRASKLLMNGRSAHKQSRMLIHASMIRLRDCLWLNCYTFYEKARS